MTLIEFLLARIDEDETDLPVLGDRIERFGGHLGDWHERVTRECEAKRRIITETQAYEAKIDGEWGCCHGADQIAAGECPDTPVDEIPIFRALALPYADHPDYCDEWRPNA